MKNVTCMINFYVDSSDYDNAYQFNPEKYDYIDSLINSIFADEAEFERRCFA